jgi:hypothetical protein
MTPASQGLGDTSSDAVVYLGFILRLFRRCCAEIGRHGNLSRFIPGVVSILPDFIAAAGFGA